MSLFSKENRETFFSPIWMNNPVTMQVLGICSALAVTVKLEPALVMGLSVTIIVAVANLVVSLLRNTIPNRIRIIVQLVVVAALVTIVSEVLKAFAYDVSVQLSVYVGLIITNCILMGRLEAFAMANGPWESFLDGLGNGFGYAAILVVVAFVRELFSAGTLLGFKVIPDCVYELGYMNNGLMLMPPMALVLLGCIIWFQRAKNPELND
ncbi:MAG: NADH:ubiquinone reductase (Na(+)-transporting) subunit D [Paludibacteraceae bacterium]|nr:NADH:ubiquinone reductase (Na(+)-transporting) subunit D [Paludibacteraceae bacterium]